MTEQFKNRHERKANRIRKDQSLAGAVSICEKCGEAFNQVWVPERKCFTKFKTCGKCRLSHAGKVAKGTQNISKATITYEPHEKQKLIHASKARFKVLACGARFGKDRCSVMEFIQKFAEMLSEDRGPELVPRVHAWIIAPVYKMSRQVWMELKAYFPREWIIQKWESDQMIETAGGGLIEVRSADDPDMLVGVGLDMVWITEAARIPRLDEVWTNLETRLMSPGRGPGGKGGIAIINSTPKGSGFFKTMFRWGQKGDPLYDENWESWQFSSWANPYLTRKDKKYLDSIKKRYPERIYRQEICVTPDTVIYGKIPKRADEVKVGDYVYSHTGKLRRVKKVMSREFTGDLISIKSYKGDGFLSLTPEHPVLSYRAKRSHRHQETPVPEWRPASKLQKGDYIAYPEKLSKAKNGLLSLYLSDFTKHGYLKNKDGWLYYKPKWTGDNPVQRKNPKKVIPDEVILDRQVLRLLGLWLAEGHVAQSKLISWSFNAREEQHLIDEVITTLKNRFNLTAKIYSMREDNTVQVFATNVFLADFILEMCGKGAENKKLHDVLFNLNNEQIANLLSGYFDGDGYVGDDKANCATISKQLAKQIRFLLMKLGIESGTSIKKVGTTIINGKKYKTKPIYKIQIYNKNLALLKKLFYGQDFNSQEVCDHTWRANGYRWLRIREIKRTPYNGIVYNYEVDRDNTYLTENGIVHNCAEFLDEGNSVFPGVEACATFNGSSEPEPGEQYVIGYDPARSIDF